MATVYKKFGISSASGTIMFGEGQEVTAEIAKMYPQFMEGYTPSKKEVAHDPTLPAKLTRTSAGKMTTARLEAWVLQYYPGNAPEGKLSQEELVELVMALQE